MEQFVYSTYDNSPKRIPLEAGRSVEMTTSGGKITGIVDFISHCQGAHNIFIDGGHSTRMILKIYSNRKMVELITYGEASVKVVDVQLLTVTCKGKQVQVNIKDLLYEAEIRERTIKAVEPGYKFSVYNDDYEVLAVSSDKKTIFIEETRTGKGFPLRYNDDPLKYKFQDSMTWGTPTE